MVSPDSMVVIRSRCEIVEAAKLTLKNKMTEFVF